MVTAGVDCGAKSVKVVIVQSGRLLSKASVSSGVDTSIAALQAYETALDLAGLTSAEVHKVCATGSGRAQVTFSSQEVTEVTADAMGAVHLFPGTRTVIDVGAEEARAMRVDGLGKVVDFAVNDKCAAGAGAFVEAMARALEVDLEEMGALSMESSTTVAINAQCAVFAESEVVSLLHARTPKPDMARAIHDAIAERVASMARRVGVEPLVVLIGGLAKNVGFVHSLSRALGMDVRTPGDPEFVGALGAALIAAQ